MKLKRLMSAACCMSAVALMAVACGGGEESDCGDNQTFASINGGAEQCYDKCSEGTCAAGFSCKSGLCVSGAANNTSNSTNNASNNTSNNASNNGSNNANNTSNNSMSNNSMSNNNMNNQMCATPVNLGTCEPLCQTGCADDEGCSIGRSGPNAPLTAACTVAGTVAPGGMCDGMNGCQAGSVCIVEDAMATSGECLEICQPGGAACTQAGAACAAQNNEMTIGFCIVAEDACDPLNDMCPAGEKCAATNLGLQCFATAGGMAGDTCDVMSTTMAPCDKGLICAQVGNATTCRVLCDPMDGSNCQGGTSCQASQSDPTLGICL